MKTQLTRGLQKRLMYVENKDGDLDGVDARIGWVTFSKTGRTVFYRGRELRSIGGNSVRGNFIMMNSMRVLMVEAMLVLIVLGVIVWALVRYLKRRRRARKVSQGI